MLAARYGLPDLGLAALGEMVDGAREIVAATDLPCIIDADDGYGDVKSVARTMELYQRLGVAGMILEDQARDAKQPGDAKARGLVPEALVEQKIAAAGAARSDPDLLIIARTSPGKSMPDTISNPTSVCFRISAHSSLVRGPDLLSTSVGTMIFPMS